MRARAAKQGDSPRARLQVRVSTFSLAANNSTLNHLFHKFSKLLKVARHIFFQKHE